MQYIILAGGAPPGAASLVTWRYLIFLKKIVSCCPLVLKLYSQVDNVNTHTSIQSWMENSIFFPLGGCIHNANLERDLCPSPLSFLL